MHVHPHAHGASPIRQDANANGASSLNATSPFSVMADGDASTTSTSAMTDAAKSAAPATSFSGLAGNLQALLLGIGQNGTGAAAGQAVPSGEAGALQAYGRNGLFG